MDGGSGFLLPAETGTTSLQCFECREYILLFPWLVLPIIFYNSTLGTFCVCVISADEHYNFYAVVKVVIFLMLFSKDQVTGI